MATFVPIPDIIAYAQISQFLAANDISKTMLFKGGEPPVMRLSRLLYIVRQSVQWLYSVNQNDERLPEMANYLYWLCGKYIGRAKTLIGNAGGVVVVPGMVVVAGSKVIAEWTVPEAGYPGIGDDTYSNSLLAGVPANRIVVFRTAITQFHSDQGDGETYITKMTDDNFFTFSSPLTDREKIQVVLLAIQIDKSASVPPTPSGGGDSSSFTGDLNF